MQLGIVFPTTEIGNDPIVIRDWAQAAEEMGYEYVLFSDHIVGGNPAAHPRGNNATTPYHEPFVTMGYLAAVTQRIKLTTGVLVLPQRQTALAAKQAAEVDVLSGGRLILGVGVGNSELEYEAQREDIHNRGRRLDEQIEVLRALWTQPAVTFHGRYHDLSDVAINPRPLQQPIPIWVGGRADAALERAGRLADGWVPSSGTDLGELIEKIASAAEAAGRSIDDVLIAPRIMDPLDGGPEAWLALGEMWRGVGVRCVFLNTRDLGLKTLQEHLDLGERFRDVMRTLG
jgi:probable F420-dependent oxidoreductase